ncbi:MAX gene-associated protein isoform X2 [Colossoma macropomum]|uniref:MAX gene-associated protein isoform X2 n=1 Tax=Colossoma macropomum TaxID=42526 RepID=UPI0018651758|nr:MAX gene-associated protein isoform X2 [Colossoma macropomum]
MNQTALQEQPMPNFAFTMEVDATAERPLEMACTASTPPSVSVFLKPGEVDDCSNNHTLSVSKQTSHPVALSLVKSTKSSTKSNYTSTNIKATLENESVWSRFHCLGTEMILTKQGRRMFPCCRFRLNGLDPERKYALVMDIRPLDAFTHKWNGKTWEPAAMGEPHVLARVCVHPESPAFGHQWMESPVSFYKVKLTSISTDQDGCVFLHPMHRYQPRLHVVPVDRDSKESIALDSPNVQTFTFPKTEFYAVTSYQNPQITQLKIDCNPFAMAFRKDSQSIRLLQDKLGLCSPGGPQTQHSGLNLASYSSEQNRKESVLKDAISPCIKDHSRKSLSPGSSPPKERAGTLIKMKNAVSGCLNGVALCKEDVNSNENNSGKEVVQQSLTKPALDEHLAPLDVEPSVTASIQEPSRTVNGSTASSNVVSKDAVNSQLSYAHGKLPTEAAISAQVSQSQGRMKLKLSALPKPCLLKTSQVNRRNTTAHFRRKPFRRARKARSKWWSNVRYSKPPPEGVIPPPDVSLQPDLEDVEGVLFVSFAAKEALDIHVQNMKPVETSLPPLSENQSQSDTHVVEDVSLSVEERITKLESTLLLHLKQQKHRQVIHPLLQEVGMKLSLLDPTAAIDLQYLGVRLPFPPPVHNSLDQMNPEVITPSHDGAGSFVSRTGKTNDLTKIKGWRDKFSTNRVQSAPEGLRNHSAFCSDMLDEYLENEAQQISDRVAVFSKSSSTPVSYQLPSKSSSYVVTLDSLLKTRSTSLNKVYSSHANIQSKPLLGRSPKNSVPFCSEGSSYSTFENKAKSSNFAHSFQSDQAISSTGPLPRLGRKNQPNRPQLRWSYGMTPAKMQMRFMLRDLEEEAFFNGKVRTHITTERANFALSSLVTSQKSVKRTKFSTLHHKDECSEDFCRLGCICDSLQRKIRGPTHCRREQCMFDCNCFKHKVLLIHPPKVTNIQRGRKRALMAFPIADPEKRDRPPPATSVTTLWKLRTEENDSEPLFIPEPAPSFKKVPRMRTYVPRPTPQMQEEDKDPVYLYFESKMTCARVREYNSNPPPQVHMLPYKKVMQDAEKHDHCFEAGVPPTSQKRAEKSTTGAGERPKGAPSAVKTDAPEPTKLLEILSECNWEPHRNLVLSSLFWRMSNNLFSEPFCVGMYKVQLLSTTLKRGETCSTVTYKVCVSRTEERKATSDLQPVATRMLKTKVSKARETKSKKGNCVVSAHMVPQRKSSPLTDKPNKPPCKKTSKIFPLLTHALPAGYLKAAKKKPGGPAHGLIKVNGKMYNQAKLLLGQMGALHPANRFAAFVTGRLRPKPPDHPKVLADVPKPCLAQAPAEPSTVPKVINISKTTPPTSSRPLPAIAPKTKAVSKRTRSKLTPLTALSKLVEQSTSLKEDVSIISTGQSPDTTPLLSAGTKLVNVPVPPSSSAGTPSETTTTAALPPGQQVVLQHLPGVSGSNFFCQYNGQVIQLVPIAPGPTGQPQPCLNSEGSTPQVIQTTNTCLPKDATSVQKPLSAISQSKPLLRPFPIIAPKIFSLSGSSGMNIASGTPAFNLQSSFSGKTGTFSFRICPPSAEGKAVGSQQGAKPPDQLVAAPAALVLPGGFTLIKLPLGPSVSAVPADSTTPTSLPVELPQKDECREKVMSESCSPRTEQRCQASESNIKKLIPETSNTNSTDAAGLNHGKSVPTSEGVGEDKLTEKTLDLVETSSKTASGKYDWVPKGAEMVLKSEDDCESEHEDMDDWPPKGAERVLWIEEDSTDEEEKEDFSKQLNNNADTSVKSPAGMKAKNIKTTRALQDVSETSQSSSSVEQKHMISTLVAKDKELVHDDSNHRMKHEQDGSSIVMKKEPNNKPTQTLSPTCCNDKKVLLQVNGSLIQTEPCEEPTEKVSVANQPNVCEQGLVPENSSLIISKTEDTESITQVHTLSNHLDIQEQGIVPGNSGPNNIIPVNKQATNKSPTATVSNHPDHNKQNLNSYSSNVIHHQELSGQKQTESLFSTSSNTSAVEHDEADDDNYIDIDGDVPCPLLEGQTPAISAPPVEHLPNTASKNTDLSGLCLLPIMQKSFSPNNTVLKFGKQLVNYSGIPRTAKQVEEEDVPEKQKLLKNKWLQFQKADQGLCVDEEEDVTQVHLSDDGDPGNDSDSDSSEGSSDDNDDDEEEDSSSDDEDSSDDSESTSNSETEESVGTSSKEDDAVDIESFEENQEKRIISKMKAEVRQYRKSKQRKAKRADKFRKQLNHRTDAFDKMEPGNELAKRLTHTEKERMRRGEMRQSFASLKTALNVEEQMKMCKHDILIQARLMIRALEDRNRTLEERKKALLQRQSAYINTIAQLSGKTEEMVKINFKEKCEQEKCPDIQNPVPASVTSPQINARRLDGEGNQLPPRLGQWKSNNYLRQRAKKSSVQPSVTPSARKRRKVFRTDVMEDCEQEKWLDVQNPIPAKDSTPQINPRRIDSEGNQLPPRLGLWKSVNYVRKRSKKSCEQPSITTAADESSNTCMSNPVSLGIHVVGPLLSVKSENIILKLVAQNPTSLPPVPNNRNLSADLQPSGLNTVPQLNQRALVLPSVPSSKTALSQTATGPFTLPKIVLQSFGMADTVEKLQLTGLEKTPLPSSPQASKAAVHSMDVTLDVQNEEAGTEMGDSLKICKETEKSLGSEESNEEIPSSSPPVIENCIQNITVTESEKDKPLAAGLVKLRKKRAKRDVIIEDALSNPDALGPRCLGTDLLLPTECQQGVPQRKKGRGLLRRSTVAYELS